MAVVKKAKGDVGIKKKKVPKEERDDGVKIVLPKERTEPVDDLGAYCWLIFGEKKIGKTSLTSKMGKAVHLLTEPQKALRLYPVTINDWRSFRRAVRLLKKDT